MGIEPTGRSHPLDLRHLRNGRSGRNGANGGSMCGSVRILANVVADEPFCRDYPNVELRENPSGGARGDWDLNLLS
jgi:hypothetical protein